MKTHRPSLCCQRGSAILGAVLSLPLIYGRHRPADRGQGRLSGSQRRYFGILAASILLHAMPKKCNHVTFSGRFLLNLAPEIGKRRSGCNWRKGRFLWSFGTETCSLIFRVTSACFQEWLRQRIIPELVSFLLQNFDFADRLILPILLLTSTD